MAGTAEGRPPEPEVTDVLDGAEAGGKAIRGSALRTGGYVASAVLALISAPLLFRYLGVVDFGRYSTVLSIVALVAGVTEAGLGAVGLREYSTRTGRDREVFMRTVLGARLVLSIAGIAAACAFVATSGYGEEMVVGTAVAGVGLMIGVYQSTLFIPFGAGLRYGWITASELLRSGVMVLLVVVLVVTDAGMVALLAVPIPVNLAVLALTVALVRRYAPFRPAVRAAPILRMLRETLPLAAATIVSTLYFRIVIIIMSLVATGYETGLFATSYRIVEVLNGIPALLIAATFPILSRAARDDDARLGYALQRLFEVALIGGVLLALATALSADLAVAFIGGDEAAPAADVLRIQALALVPITLTFTWTHGLLAMRRHRDLLVANGLALAAVVLLTLVLVGPFDATGAAVAVVLGETVLAAASGLLVRRARGSVVQSAAIVPKLLLATALAAGPPLALGLPSAVAMPLAVAVYLVAIFALRAVPGELTAAFAGRLRAATGGA